MIIAGAAQSVEIIIIRIAAPPESAVFGASLAASVAAA
jgi:hypothetical protein